MYIVTSIKSDDEKYELFAFLMDGKYNWPALCKGDVDDEDSWVWDNKPYLYDTLIPILMGCKNSKEIENYIPIEDFPIVRDILAKGIEMGFFNDMQK